MSWCPETVNRILASCLPSWPHTRPLCPQRAFWAFCYPRRRHHHLLGQSFSGDSQVPISEPLLLPPPPDLGPQSTGLKSSIASSPSDRGFSSQGRQQEGRGTGSELQQESEVGSIPTGPPPPPRPKGAWGKGLQGQGCRLRGWESLGPWTRF